MLCYVHVGDCVYEVGQGQGLDCVCVLEVCAVTSAPCASKVLVISCVSVKSAALMAVGD